MTVQICDRCPDCDAGIGALHVEGCDVEQCPYCGGQLISCLCPGQIKFEEVPADDRMPWTGAWPGTVECVKFGWYARLVPSQGWVPCGPKEPEAYPDLNRLHKEARWNRKLKRFVKKKK